MEQELLTDEIIDGLDDLVIEVLTSRQPDADRSVPFIDAVIARANELDEPRDRLLLEIVKQCEGRARSDSAHDHWGLRAGAAALVSRASYLAHEQVVAKRARLN